MKTDLIPARRPTTEGEIQVIQRRAYDFAKKGDYESALALCNWLIDESSTRTAGLRKRAAVLEHQGEINKAIEDLEAVIAADVDEPADMYSLGLLYLQVGHYRDAESLLDQSIELCVAKAFEYYLNPCRILRAEALLRLGRKEAASQELNQLPPGYSTHVYGRGRRTKEIMMEEARRG